MYLNPYPPQRPLLAGASATHWVTQEVKDIGASRGRMQTLNTSRAAVELLPSPCSGDFGQSGAGPSESDAIQSTISHPNHNLVLTGEQ